MRIAVYEIHLKSDEKFVFWIDSKKYIHTLKEEEKAPTKGESGEYPITKNCLDDTLKVAHSDVDKYLFHNIQSVVESLNHVYGEGNSKGNVFVIKKVLNEHVTEVAIMGFEAIGTTHSEYYQFIADHSHSCNKFYQK